MKLRGIFCAAIIALLSVGLAQGADSLLQELDARLVQVGKVMRSSTDPHQPLLELNRSNAVQAVAKFIGDSDQNDWHRPSNERLLRNGKVADVIADHSVDLVELGCRDSDYSPDALALLCYAKPTTGLREHLRNAAQTRSNTEQRLKIYDALIYLRLDDPEVRQEITKEITTRSSSMSSFGASLLARSIDWGLPELEGVYADILTRAPQAPLQAGFEGSIYKAGPNTGELGEYKIAAKGLMLLGRDSEKHLPKLEHALQNLRKIAGIDHSTVRSLEGAIAVARGERSPVFASALNGTGAIGISARVLLGSHDQTFRDLQMNSSPTGNQAKQSDLTSPMTKPTASSGETSGGTLRIILGVLIVAAIGLLWLVLKKRK